MLISHDFTTLKTRILPNSLLEKHEGTKFLIDYDAWLEEFQYLLNAYSYTAITKRPCRLQKSGLYTLSVCRILTDRAWAVLSFESWDFALGTSMEYGSCCLV